MSCCLLLRISSIFLLVLYNSIEHMVEKQRRLLYNTYLTVIRLYSKIEGQRIDSKTMNRLHFRTQALLSIVRSLKCEWINREFLSNAFYSQYFSQRIIVLTMRNFYGSIQTLAGLMILIVLKIRRLFIFTDSLLYSFCR